MKHFLIGIFGVLCYYLGLLLGLYVFEEEHNKIVNKYNKDINYLNYVVDSLSQPIYKKNQDWDKFINALIYVESKGDSLAVNEKTNAVGVLQLTPIYIEQLNEWGYNYTLEDRYNRNKSIEMFNITNKILNPDKDLHFALVIHNGRASYNYHLAVFNKYNQLMKQND